MQKTMLVIVAACVLALLIVLGIHHLLTYHTSHLDDYLFDTHRQMNVNDVVKG